MTSYTLVISPVAQDDLKNIYQYGVLNWGIRRATTYFDHIQSQLWQLTNHPQMGADRDELFPALRSLTIESHVAFYRFHNQQIEIIRLLHARQDPQRHLNQ